MLLLSQAALKLCALTGECVADYSLRLKAELGFESTWVTSYCNELLAYVPSERVRAEGGMEGGEAMMEYRHAARFGEGVEAAIVSKVHELLAVCKAAPTAAGPEQSHAAAHNGAKRKRCQDDPTSLV